MAVALSGIDAVCMVILIIAALAWKGTANAKRADLAVVIIQLVVFVGEALFLSPFVLVLVSSAVSCSDP